MKCEICDSDIVNKKMGNNTVPYCESCKQIKSKSTDNKTDFKNILEKEGDIADKAWNRIKPLALDKESDHMISEIALKAVNDNIRRQAMRYVNDKILSQISSRDRNFDNRILSISLLTEEKYLMHIGAYGKTFDEKMLAVRMIKERSSLLELMDKIYNKKVLQAINKRLLP